MVELRRRLKDALFLTIGAHNHLSSDAYIAHARAEGCRIGEGTQFFGEKKLDLSRAPMIEIGENCVITDRVRILGHTWDQPILTRRFGDAEAPNFEAVGPVTVGDNVFLGENTIVLPGCTIGDDTIVGAGSVVTGDLPAESVAAGNPCRVLMSIEEYRDRRVEDELDSLRTYLDRHKQRGVELPADIQRLVDDSGDATRV